MRYFLFCLLLVASCSRSDTKTDPTILEQARPMWVEACSTYQPSQTTKCDRSTFVAWMSVACNKDFGIQEYKKEPGVYWRDTSDCYGQGESRSQCSRDAYLGIIFYAYISNDIQTLEEIYDYGKDHGWTMCQGAESATNIRDLSPILSSILEKKENSEKMSDDWSDDSQKEKAIPNPLAGFRGHLLAGYLWLDATYHKGSVQSLLMQQLHNETNASPYFSALYHRYSDNNDQSGTLSRMRDVPRETGIFWQGSPWQYHVAASYAVMKGFQ
jgi:hypothetical protein